MWKSGFSQTPRDRCPDGILQVTIVQFEASAARCFSHNREIAFSHRFAGVFAIDSRPRSINTYQCHRLSARPRPGLNYLSSVANRCVHECQPFRFDPGSGGSFARFFCRRQAAQAGFNIIGVGAGWRCSIATNAGTMLKISFEF